MNVQDCLKNRYSHRTFRSEAVPDTHLQQILAAANLAPTAHNKQAFHLYVLQGDGVDAWLTKVTKCNYHAPVNILITQDTSESWKREDHYDNGPIDIGIVGTHILLTATELGLGSCWIGVLDEPAIRAGLNLPAHEQPVALFEIGYPTDDAKPSPLHTQRKGVDALVSYTTINT